MSPVQNEVRMIHAFWIAVAVGTTFGIIGRLVEAWSWGGF